MLLHRLILDVFRQYVLIYQWIKGISADEAFTEIAGEERRRILGELTESVRKDLKEHGYMVVDHKPAHIIVRPRKNGAVLRKRGNDFAYALVDFELLTRTEDHQHHLDLSRRATYLRHQRASFSAPPRSEMFPEHLKPVTILDVDYVFGHAESTHGRLWVVGHDPELFDYFIPVGYRDLTLKPSHFLLSLRHDKTLILDPDGLPALRICNFELVQANVR